MTIRYKVVYKFSRTSTSAKGSYCIVYHKNTTVKASPNTLGIMVFKRRWQAKQFGESYIPGHYIIVRVRTFSRGRIPKRISMSTVPYSLNAFYIKSGDMRSMMPPTGTICYDKVEVLD